MVSRRPDWPGQPRDLSSPPPAVEQDLRRLPVIPSGIEPRLVVPPEPSPLPSGARSEAVQRQLARLFGESLIGPWPELERHLEAGGTPRVGRAKSRRLLWAALVAAVIAGVVLAMGSVVRPGLNRRSSDQRAHYADELRTFLQDGELERAREFVTLVREEQGTDVEPGHAQLDLVLRAEAAIYRYFDADPVRLEKIRPHLDLTSSGASPDRLIAGLTVLSRQERAAHWSVFERLRTPLEKDAEFAYLVASTLEQRGETGPAREAWERSARLGPAWLVHRFEQAQFEQRRGELGAAKKVATQMLRVDPDSAWSELAIAQFQLTPAPRASSEQTDRARITPPVEVFHAQLLGAMAAARQHDLGQAKRFLDAAAAAVNGQAPFLFDAFDWLLAAELGGLARELTLLPAWPRESELARAQMRRLSPAATRAEPGRP